MNILKEFFDFKDGNHDKSSEEKLKELKAKIKGKLSSSNVFNYNSKFKDKKVNNDHLNELCKDVYNSLEKIIKSQIDEFKDRNDLDLEIEAHKKFGMDNHNFL